MSSSSGWREVTRRGDHVLAALDGPNTSWGSGRPTSRTVRGECSCGQWERGAGSPENLQVSWLEGHIFGLSIEEGHGNETLIAPATIPSPKIPAEPSLQEVRTESSGNLETTLQSTLLFDTPSTLSDESKANLENRFPRVFEKYPRAWSSWSEDEDAHLRMLFATEQDPKVLAEAHLRMVGGIRSRLVHLGLIDSTRATGRISAKTVAHEPTTDGKGNQGSVATPLIEAGLGSLSTLDQWDPALTDALVQRAIDDDITISEVVRDALKSHLNI